MTDPTGADDRARTGTAADSVPSPPDEIRERLPELYLGCGAGGAEDAGRAGNAGPAEDAGRAESNGRG